MNRPPKLNRIAYQVMLEAVFSTCQRAQVGASLFDLYSGQILVLARNGTPSNQLHCNKLAKSDVRCIYCIHAERNSINRAARIGLQTRGLGMLSLLRPCISCANDILEAGIIKVYYLKEYNTDGQQDYVKQLLGTRLEWLDIPDIMLFETLLKEWKSLWT